MNNNIYSKMNVQKIADKIIETEMAYLKTDLTSLSFEEKCRLLLRNNSTYHPLFRQLDLSDIAREISPELTRRAESGEAFSLYCMSATFGYDLPRTDTRLSYLERAMKAGSMDARVQYASRFSGENERDTARALLEETLDLYSLGDITDEDKENLFRCYDMLSVCGQTSEDRAYYSRLADSLALALVLNGSFYGLSHLCVSDNNTDESKEFWKKVAYIVRSCFYERGATQFEDILKAYKKKRSELN